LSFTKIRYLIIINKEGDGMKMSIRTKFLAICIFLVVLTTVSISTAYYFLAKRDKQRESQERIRIAFDMILDEVTSQLTMYTKRTDEFLKSSRAIQIATSMYFSRMNTQNSSNKAEILKSIARTYFFHVADELNRFAQIVPVYRLKLYGPDSRLMAAYHRYNGQETVGFYIFSEQGNDTYLSLDDRSQATQILSGHIPTPDLPLPEGISGYFSAEMPKTISSDLLNEDNKLGVRITTPIYHIEKNVGVLVGEVLYNQSMIERYASLSKTAVNLFAGNQLSIGTLRAQTHLKPEEMEQLLPCEALQSQDGETDVLSVTLDDQNYYQGRCALLTNTQGMIGAITISLSQNIEKRAIREVLLAVLTISGIALGVAIGLAFLFSREAIRTIQNIVTVIGSVAEGDLRKIAVSMTRDEFGMLAAKLNQMIEHLRTMVGQVQRSGIQVTSSATELAATAKQQEVTVKTQVESMNKVVNSVKEISDVATNLVETMQRVAAMSQGTTEFANRGQSDLLRMEEAMRHMEDASKSISGKLEAINEKAENITTVVTTINKVSEQTNLLSLNASIEAEKAGEYGRGFAVVAREIRRLADQTAVATLDIGRMVQEMQSAVSSGIMEMDKFIAEVRRSAEDVGKISMQLTLIIDQVQALSPNFEEVNVAMGHQSEHARGINEAMMRLSEEMQQTKDSLHETYSAIEQLNEAARGLQEEVSRFKVN
jgi:methyl-accepting chemotaxis protein